MQMRVADVQCLKNYAVCVLLAQLCPTPCDPVDCSPQGPSVHGVSQAGILEWFVISVSKNYAMYITITLHRLSIKFLTFLINT